MRINLREEETERYKQTMEQFLVELQNSSKKMYDDLNEILVNTSYAKLQQVISTIMSGYNDMIMNDVSQKAFTDWADSPSSLRHSMRKYMVGEAAEEICEELQNQIGDLMNEMLQVEMADFTAPERPVINEGDFERIKIVLQTYGTELEDIQGRYKNQIMSMKESNEIFGSMIYLFKAVCDTIAVFIPSATHEIEKLHEFVIQNAMKMQDIADEATGSSSEVAGSTGATGNKGGSGDTGGANNTGTSDATEEAATAGQNADAGNDGESTQTPAMSDENNHDNTSDEPWKGHEDEILKIIQEIIEAVGVDKLNTLIDKYSDTIEGGLEAASKNLKQTNQEKHSASKKSSNKTEGKNIYGRYTVNDETIELMEGLVYNAGLIMSPIEEYYKERYRAIEDKAGFLTVKSVVEKISSVVAGIGLGSWDFNKSSEENSKFDLQIGSIIMPAMMFGPTGAIAIAGGAAAVSCLNHIMADIQENHILTRVRNKCWGLVNQFSQIPVFNRYLEQYMVEKYELKTTGNYNGTMYFVRFHKGMSGIEDERQRAIMEHSIFSAEDYTLNPQNYQTIGMDGNEKKIRSSFVGLFLNLVRAGLAGIEGVDAETANKLTDALYDVYVADEFIQPRTELNPAVREIR